MSQARAKMVAMTDPLLLATLLFIFLEGYLPLCLVLLNLSLGLLLGLLEPPVLPLPGLTHLLISSLLSSKEELLDALGLACHC